MDNLIICPACEKRIIIDEYQNHECLYEITNIITLGIVTDHGIALDKNGDEVRLIRTVKGELLRLIKCDHQIPHNLPPSTESKHDKDYRQGNRTD